MLADFSLPRLPPAAPSIVLLLISWCSLAVLFDTTKRERFLFRPYWVQRRSEWSTIISSTFVHADPAHLLFNLLAFWSFAFPLTQKVGNGSFALLYAAGIAGSQWLTWVRHRDEPSYQTLGASGAVSAVMLAFVVLHPLTEIMMFPIPVPLPGIVFAVPYVIYSVWASKRQHGFVNHEAHMGGAAVGVIAGLGWRP